MKNPAKRILIIFTILFSALCVLAFAVVYSWTVTSAADSNPSRQETLDAMRKASDFMDHDHP